MKRSRMRLAGRVDFLLPWMAWLYLGCGATALKAAAPTGEPVTLPIELNAYTENAGASLLEILRGRIAYDSFNLVATLIFASAIAHTFLTAKIRHWAHLVEMAHAARRNDSREPRDDDGDGQVEEVSFGGQILHFFGEIEAVFGIWAVVLAGAIAYHYGWATMVDYIGERVNFTEAMFVVVIMAIASTRPVLGFAEACLQRLANIGAGSVGAWWLAVLMVAPLLGSFITEPAAMTIGALLLGSRFYTLKPPPPFAYATLGLLFVNVSVGGTLTHFAAPPVLMVSAPWGWNTPFLLLHFGWKALIGIVVATTGYFLVFRRTLQQMEQDRAASQVGSRPPAAVPPWITIVHVLFLGFTVFVAHYPPLFIGAFLFFLAFTQATAHHQGRIDLRPPLLVGFFLAGLVIHGGLQAWWIEPVLTRLTEVPLFVGAAVLTAFNDNAAITYLATLVPGFTDALKYAVVAGAVTGGGLTVIANAPNPAGQTILQRFFPDGVSPLKLFLAAMPPTLVMAGCFLIL